MKKIIVAIIFMVMTSMATCALHQETQGANDDTSMNNNLLKNIVFIFLEPIIQEVLEDYYPRPLKYDRRNIKITSIERPNGGGTFYFRIKVEVRQYTGPYDKIGIDLISLETASKSGFRALEFKHTEGFDFHQEVSREPLSIDSQAGTPQWPENADAEICRDLSLLLLSPYIDQAIKDYYAQPLAHDPWSDQIKALTQAKEKNKTYYIIQMEVIPYTGPHNSVGIDDITLTIESGPNVNMKQFKHMTDNKSRFRLKEYTPSPKGFQIISYLKRILFEPL